MHNPRPPQPSLPLDSSSLNAALRWARNNHLSKAASQKFWTCPSLTTRPCCPVAPVATQRIVQLNVRKGIEDPALRQMLRLSVEPGGCSGFSYKFELEETGGLDEEDDTCVQP